MFVRTAHTILAMRAALRGKRLFGAKIMLTPTAPARLLSRRDAAAYLAISPRKLDQLTADGDLPRVKIGSCVRFEQAATSMPSLPHKKQLNLPT